MVDKSNWLANNCYFFNVQIKVWFLRVTVATTHMSCSYSYSPFLKDKGLKSPTIWYLTLQTESLSVGLHINILTLKVAKYSGIRPENVIICDYFM